MNSSEENETKPVKAEMLYVIRVPDDGQTRWLAIAVPEENEDRFRSDFIQTILDNSTLDFESYDARIVEQGERGKAQPTPEQYDTFREAFGAEASTLDAPRDPKRFLAGNFSNSDFIDPRPMGERVKHDQKVAFTQNGTALESYEGLRRFLIKTRDDIATDKHHMMEELTCDLASIIETGMIIQEIGTGHADHVADNLAMSGFTIASASAAAFLLHSLNSQRAGKEIEYKRALRMFHEHERDKRDPDNGETREDRFDVADANLAKKMRASGLQFVNLSNEQRKFDKPLFREEARQRGIGVPVTAHLVARTGDFLRKDRNEKLAVTGEALSRVKYTAGQSVRGIGNEAGRLLKIYINNTTRVAEVWRSTVMGFQEAKALKQDDDKKVTHERENGAISNRINHQNGNAKPESTETESEPAEDVNRPLTLEDLGKVNLQTIESIGHAIDEEEKEALIRTINDQQLHENNARRARTSLCVQSVFQASQAILVPVKLMNEEYRNTVPLNIVAFLGAMGPLKGFADELKSERAKANHKKAERAERLGKLLNLIPETEKDTPDDHDDFDGEDSDETHDFDSDDHNAQDDQAPAPL